MGCGEQAIVFGKPGFVNFIRKEGTVPLQGDCVDLSTRIYLDHHQLGSIMGGKLGSGEEGLLTIGNALGEQGTFGLGCGCITVVEYDVYAILGVLVWCFPAMGMVRPEGDVLWLWLQEWLQEGLWEGL